MVRIYSDYSLLLGYGKTALDVVTQAADLAKSAHLIYREPRWIIPEWMFGMIYFGTIFFARHASYFMDSWSLAPWQAFVQRYLWFIPWMFWRTMEVVFCVSMRWGYGHPLIPTTPIEKSFRVAIALAPPNFGPRVREKKVSKGEHSLSLFTGPDTTSQSKQRFQICK